MSNRVLGGVAWLCRLCLPPRRLELWVVRSNWKKKTNRKTKNDFCLSLYVYSSNTGNVEKSLKICPSTGCPAFEDLNEHFVSWHASSVTRLGVVSSMGWLFTLESLFHNRRSNPKFWDCVFQRQKLCVNFGLGHIFGDFFTNSSGHPASKQASSFEERGWGPAL
jgi:hypothetical protein